MARVLNYLSGMSTAELQEIVTKLALSQAETDRQIKESQAETDRQIKESQAETDRQMKETDRKMKQTDKQLKELGKQIGGLGNKFGSFAEGLAYNSIKRILERDFKMNEFVAPGVKVTQKGLEDEYDVLAYSNGSIDKGMIVEIKSKLKQEDIDQMKRKMKNVFTMMPDHTDKTFYGMIAYVTGHSSLKKQIIDNGWYLAHIGDEIFEMETPVGFQPKGYTSEKE